MPKPYLLIALPIVAGLAVASFVQAQTEATVSATVQFQNIAISVTDGSINYGTLGSSGTANTLSGDLNDQQTATNDGNVPIDVNIQGQDATSGSGTDWTLDTTNGADQYTHEFSTTTGSTWDFMATSTFATMETAVASTSQVTFDLRITVPSSSTDTDQKNADVTVQAVAS